MNFDQMAATIASADGFIAALDQSGGSTPRALRGYGAWSIEDRETGVYLGEVGLFHPAHYPQAELGWMVVPEAARKEAQRAGPMSAQGRRSAALGCVVQRKQSPERATLPLL